jgi:CheY-like chemotaxis protein
MILVVEDDHAVQAFATAVLTHLGYHVEVAADGRQAIELLPTIATPDLLLTDMVLPGGMDGLKTAQEVVRRCPTTRVLIVSGHTDRDFLRSGGQDLEFMPKPYTREALAARVRKVLDA